MKDALSAFHVIKNHCFSEVLQVTVEPKHTGQSDLYQLISIFSKNAQKCGIIL